MTNTLTAGPSDPLAVTREEVLEVLTFLIAIEPDPDDDDIDSVEDYLARMAPRKAEIDRAMATLRQYADQRQPQSLAGMQAEYHAIAQDDRYADSETAIAVATSALAEAWDGIGSWRK